jgi:COMPASS component SWD3
MHRESRQSDSSYLQLLGIRAILSNNSNSFKKQFNNEHIKHLAIEKVIQTDTHRGCVFGLKFSPDGKYLAAATTDSVEIWEHARGKKTMVLTDHKEIVTSILWMKTNPQCFYTSSLDKTIKFYRDFTPVATLCDHADWIRCLAASPSDTTVISGCVSSRIYGWDTETNKSKFKIMTAHYSTKYADLNTINSLNYSTGNDAVFISGARDGSVRFWDSRALYDDQPVFELNAHDAKLNNCMFSQNDLYLLTAGRDSKCRLWDLRMFTSNTSLNSVSTKMAKEYTGHSCAGYNVGGTFFNFEKNVVTGSEDKKIFIYDTQSGELVKELENPHFTQTVVHLVQPINSSEVTLVSSSIDNTRITFWSPVKTKEHAIPLYYSKENKRPGVINGPNNNNTNNAPNTTGGSTQADSDEEDEALFEDYSQQERPLLERFMQLNGDQILRVFHRYNFTLSSNLDWARLFDAVRRDPTPEAVDLITKLAHEFARSFASQANRIQGVPGQTQNINAGTNTNAMSDEDDDEGEEGEDDDRDSDSEEEIDLEQAHCRQS